MRIEYRSKTGHFNILNPKEESIVCRLYVFNEMNESIKSTSFKTEDEVAGDSVEDAIYLLEEAERRVLYHTNQKEWKEMLAFLKENWEEIEEGNKKWKVFKIMEEIEKLQKELLRYK
jgi:hypothetical protein